MFRKITGYSKSRWGFSLIEVLATVLILSFGILGVARMQMTAISASIAPASSLESATIARHVMELVVSGQTPPGTIDGYHSDDYAVSAETKYCNWTGVNLDNLSCSLVVDPNAALHQITVTVTDPRGESDPFSISTLVAQ